MEDILAQFYRACHPISLSARWSYATSTSGDTCPKRYRWVESGPLVSATPLQAFKAVDPIVWKVDRCDKLSVPCTGAMGQSTSNTKPQYRLLFFLLDATSWDTFWGITAQKKFAGLLVGDSVGEKPKK